MAQDLRVLARYPVPERGEGPATDIRWSGESSIFLARGLQGVTELALGEGLTERRETVPDLQTLGRIRNYAHLASSPQFLFVSPRAGNVAWRSTRVQRPQPVVFERRNMNLVEDADLAGDRLLLLGDARDEGIEQGHGGIAWLGTLSSHLADLKPVLYDVGGRMYPTLYKCGAYSLGAARFLPDGTFVVVPGFQAGAHLFNAAGRQIRSWNQRETGLTTDCTRLPADAEEEMSVDLVKLAAWASRHRVLDDILPLREGPGLLIRTAGPDGKIHWELRILRPEGGSVTYDIPMTGTRPLDRLAGDVRDGKIVLLRYAGWHASSSKTENRGGEILVAALPRTSR